MDLAAEAVNATFASADNQLVQQPSSDAGTPRGLLHKHFDEFHDFPAELRAPFVGCIGKAAQPGILSLGAVFTLGDEDDTEVR